MYDKILVLGGGIKHHKTKLADKKSQFQTPLRVPFEIERVSECGNSFCTDGFLLLDIVRKHQEQGCSADPVGGSKRGEGEFHFHGGRIF
jgi:hypothetical protein